MHRNIFSLTIYMLAFSFCGFTQDDSAGTGTIKLFIGIDNGALALNKTLQDYGMDHQFDAGWFIGYGVSEAGFGKKRNGLDLVWYYGRSGFSTNNRAYRNENLSVQFGLQHDFLHHSRNSFFAGVGLAAKITELRIDSFNTNLSLNTLTDAGIVADKSLMLLPFSVEYLHRFRKHLVLGIRVQYDVGIFQSPWQIGRRSLTQQIDLYDLNCMRFAIGIGSR